VRIPTEQGRATEPTEEGGTSANHTTPTLQFRKNPNDDMGGQDGQNPCVRESPTQSDKLS